MRVSERFVDGAVVLMLDGRMTVDRQSEPLIYEVCRWFALGHRCQVLDLRRVSYLDSGCLGEVAAAYQFLMNRGGSLSLLHVPRRIQQLLGIAGLRTIRTLTSDHDVRRIVSASALATAGR